MEICRACLLTEQDMIALDEFCVTSYTLLTNLKVTLGDEKPQYFCQNCFNIMKIFIDFREKAISSDAMLQDISENTKPDNFSVDNIIKVENNYEDDNVHCEDNYVFNDEAVYVNNEAKSNEVNVLNVSVEQTTLLCVLCLKKFTHSTRLMEHLREHKRGAKCKLCFEKVLLADLYAHTLRHLHDTAPAEQDTQSQEVKLEPDHFDSNAVHFVDVMKDLHSEFDAEEERKTKSLKMELIKCKKGLKAPNSMRQNLLHCGLCKMKFDCKELLAKHLEGHKYPGTASCRLCGEACGAWPQLLAHRLAHVPPAQRRCHVCQRHCFSETHMEFHYRNEHYDGEDKFLTCKQCLRPFANSRKLSKHVRTVHGVRRFICDHCNKSCTTKSRLAMHIASHGGGRRHVCDVCGFSCNRKAGLKSHKLKHYPHKVKCRNCDRVFLDQAKAEEHKLHCEPKRMICPECGKEFSKPRLLTRHLVSHVATSSYACARCPATFRTRQALKVHTDRHDGNRTQRCEYCDARFYCASVLVKHRRIHTGEKPYVCKICHKGFTGNHNLKVHMRIHGEDLIVKKNTQPQADLFFANDELLK